ncbi:MAG TPA: glycosyltransferase family 4 protein [bacterium]|nr:glycosyltransferase family 4 protein [bacterium]
MNIAYVHTDPFPSPMAGSVFALSTAVGLARAGADCTLLMPSAERTVEQALAYYGVTPPANLRIVLPGSPHYKIGPVKITRTGKYYRAVLCELLARRPDAVIVRTLKLAAFLVSHRLPLPLFYEAHDWYSDIERKWSGAEWMISPKKLAGERALSALEKGTLPRLTGLITLREATAELMRRDYPGVPCRAVPTAMQPLEKLPPVSDEPVVVYLGQLHPHKGLQLLFEAAQRAPQIKLLIVGGGEWLAHWRKTAAESGLDHRVEFTGHLPAAQVPAALARARVGVLPMLDCFFNRYLTSPLKIQEYFAAGLPVATADAPVTAEIVAHEQTGLLTPFGDVDALAAALVRLCTDDELHRRCRANILRTVARWTWEKRGAALLEFVAGSTSFD